MSTSTLPVIMEKNLYPAAFTGETAKKKPVLQFSTLGPLNIFLDGQHVSSSDFLKRRRIQDLLILLILHRKDVLRKEVIFNLFWEHYSQRSKKDNLNTLIYRLKKLFKMNDSILMIDRNSIAFNGDAIEVDVDTFAAGIEEARDLEEKGYFDEALRTSRAALSLYGGTFFDNITTVIPLQNERLRIKHIYETLLFRTLRLCVYSGLYREALIYGQQLLSCDPFCEPAYRLIMQALGFLGNTSEVTRLYRTLEMKLFNEYKIVPDEKTLNLKNRLALGVNPSPEETLQEISIFF